MPTTITALSPKIEEAIEFYTEAVLVAGTAPRPRKPSARPSRPRSSEPRVTDSLRHGIISPRPGVVIM